MRSLSSCLKFRAMSVLVLFVIGFQGCAWVDGLDGAADRHGPDDQVNHAGCAIAPTAGDKAILTNARIDKVVTSNFFEKKYDLADIEAVATASAEATAAYVKAIGIRLFRIPRSESGKNRKAAYCPTFLKVAPAPESHLKLWNEQARNTIGGSKLLGLYFENCLGDCSDTQPVKPTILIDEGTDRWTLVHEMMHHNFNVQRKADPGTPSSSSLRAALSACFQHLQQLKRAYKDAPNRQALTSLTGELDHATQILYQVLTRSYFEELATEGVLIDAFVTHKLTYVPRESAEIAFWYMADSRSKGVQRLKAMGEFFTFARQEALRYSWPEVSQQVATTEAFVGTIEKTTADHIMRAKSLLGVSPLPILQGDGSDAPAAISVENESPRSLLPKTPGGSFTAVLADDRVDGHAEAHLESLEGAQALRDFDLHVEELRAIFAED